MDAREMPTCGEDILRALAAPEAVDQRGLSSARLAAVTGRDRGLVARVVADLVELGFAERDPATRRVRLGWDLYATAARIVDGRLATRGQRALDRLVQRHGESGYVVVRRGSQSITIAEAMPQVAVRGASWLGRAQPVARGDAGPMLLSDLAADELARVVGDPLPPARTQRAARTVAELAGLVEQARADGTCVLDGHVEAGAASVSAPVWDFRGRLAGALVVVGPGPRVMARAAVLRAAVLAAATEVSADLGGTQRPVPAR